MPEVPKEMVDPEFDAQLRGLIEQAERAIEDRTARSKDSGIMRPGKETAESSEPSPAPPAGSGASLTQLIRPLVQGIEALTRATGENGAMLREMKERVAEADAVREGLPKLIAELRALSEQRSTVSQGMFDALHGELKGYKDGFLLEAVQRPVIRDLITIYDDLIEIRRQAADALEECLRASEGGGDIAGALTERLRTLDDNLSNHLELIVEVLHRMGATLTPASTGMLCKRTQRAVAVENAERVEEDGLIVRTVKQGVNWNDRIFRPEEVVIKKFKEGVLTALPSDEKR